MTYMSDDKKIEAIKAYRTLTGAGLLEAKNAVEAVMNRAAR
jgi:ribosomal protein L7/L12